MQAVSKPTIYGWYARWRNGGIEGLANRPKSGQPSKADDRYTMALGEVIEKEPSELGYDFAIWTIDRLRAHLEKETGISLSESRFQALLKRKGYRYRRPKYDLGHLQDKDAKAQAADLLDALKKKKKKALGDDFTLIFVDETTVTLDPPLRACWMKQGQQRRIPATRPGQNRNAISLAVTTGWKTPSPGRLP